ncbi:MAG TPA: hypothetical protein VHB20_09840 [Verrucomicrobiae bacterium]|nr:hypothetical protein [Verrucomicrobiae bacterium]
MKRTLLVMVATALCTGIVCSVIQGMRTGVERLWLVSAVKVPGNKAIADIQANMKEGQYGLAAAKLQAFKAAWERFDSGPDSFSGRGIGDIMATFSELDVARATNSLLHH